MEEVIIGVGNYFIQPERIDLDYHIPDHLIGIEDIGVLREKDLEALDSELTRRGSSLQEKIEGKTIWRMGFPNMVVDARQMRFNPTDRSLNIRAVPIHPHRADLAFKKDKTLATNSRPITMNVVLESKEGGIIVGLRGGSVTNGVIGTIGGHLDYPTEILSS